jgi:threonine aldolase
MRRAMAEAEVDDDVLGKDPTVERLECRVAELLGKEAALFFPSGTQANQTAMLLHGRPGTEAVCEGESHVFHYELADAAWLAGVQLHPVRSERGFPRPDAVAAAIRPGDRHHSRTSLVWLENTHNMQGGTAAPLATLEPVRAVAADHGLPVHLDGARLWNAALATGETLGTLASVGDTVMVSLSKGLGCPVGSLLAGPVELIERAWSFRKRLGGGMRQVGILAAAGLWALEHNLPELARDHERARRLAEASARIPGLRPVPPDTNILMVELEGGDVDAGEVVDRLAAHGVWMLAAGPRRIRAVTHRDVDDEGIERAVDALAAVAA